MEVFLHSASGLMPRLIDVSPSSTVEETIGAFGSEGDGLWVEDADQEIDPGTSLEQAGVREHAHVHHHRCREVDILVRYIDGERHKDFSPAATVARVLKWALGPDGFNVPEVERPAFGFLSCADGKAVPEDTHVGSLTGPGKVCEACLSLVKKHNPQG